MKKYLLFLITSCTFVFLSANIAQALFLSAGDTIRYTSHGKRVEGIGTGGGFQWVSDKGYTWSSFCIEINEYVSGNNSYEVKGLTAYATNGGRAGQDVDLDRDGSFDSDSLSDETAWLFYNFTNNSLNGYHSTNYEDQKDLQALIWLFEDEITYEQFTNYSNLYGQTKLFDWIETMEAAINNGWTNNNLVKVVNLGSGFQDQLIVAPVPEPDTMLLFGLGLLGLAGLGRKKMKAK